MSEAARRFGPPCRSAPTMLIAAACVAPMDGPLVREGAVAVRGDRIAAVGTLRQLRQEYPHAVEHDAGEVVLTPGLINAHTHLELSAVPRPVGPIGFVDWLIHVIGFAQASGESIEAIVSRGVSIGIEQSLRCGVTCVGDISRFSQLTRQVLSSGPLRTVSFGEVLAMGQRRCLLEERLAEAIDPSLQNEYLRIGVSPHSPYSIEPEGYRRCLEAAHARSLPLMTHLAETPDEAEFLSNHAGPFRELWRQLGGWDEQIPRFPDGPIRYAQMLGLLDYPAVLAHVNYCDDEELKLLAAAKASVVYCPRTHAYFGHPPHRWHEMLDLGINVAIATDSSTSSGDLNLLDDLRLFHRQAPKMSAEIVWQLATSRAALALGCPHLGSLAAGKMADIAAFPSRGSDPLAALLGSDDLPTQVWMGGKAIAAAAKRDALT